MKQSSFFLIEDEDRMAENPRDLICWIKIVGIFANVRGADFCFQTKWTFLEGSIAEEAHCWRKWNVDNEMLGFAWLQFSCKGIGLVL